MPWGADGALWLCGRDGLFVLQKLTLTISALLAAREKVGQCGLLHVRGHVLGYRLIPHKWRSIGWERQESGVKWIVWYCLQKCPKSLESIFWHEESIGRQFHGRHRIRRIKLPLGPQSLRESENFGFFRHFGGWKYKNTCIFYFKPVLPNRFTYMRHR